MNPFEQFPGVPAEETGEQNGAEVAEIEKTKTEVVQRDHEQTENVNEKLDIFSKNEELIESSLEGERIESLEAAKKEIMEAEPPKSEAVTPDHAPSDIDLSNLSPEKIKERHDQLVERYRAQLDLVSTIGAKLDVDERGGIVTQEITADKLVFVHATSFAPEVEADGSLGILNDREATDGKVPRITTHFALNHRVSANSGGQWDNKEYQIIMPGNGMFATNGRPENLMAVDTFYAKSVTLPTGTVIIYEKGYKPNIPEETIDKNKIVLIERDQSTNDSELVNIATEKMGYSRISGGGTRSSDSNINEDISKFAEGNGMTSHAHNGSWSEILESSEIYASDKWYIHALRQAERDFNIENKEETAKMPKELKQEMLKKVFDVFNETNETINTSDTKHSLDEMKSAVTNFIDQYVLSDGYDKELYMVSPEDRKIMLESVPNEAWKYYMDSMKQNIGKYFKDEEEIKEFFKQNVADKYAEIVGKPLDLKTLGL